MLTDQQPAEALIDWAHQQKVVSFALDRPWFRAEPPIFATEAYQPPCRCKKESVKLQRYACEDGNGYIYVGQCARCQTIIWSFLECAGK